MLHDLLLMMFGMVAVFSLPLAAALWRFWSKQGPRAVALRFQDREAFLYRLTEGLKSTGFHRADGANTQVVFKPGGGILGFGTMPVTVDFQTPGLARITGPARYIGYIKRWLPGGQDDRFSGSSPAGKVVKVLGGTYGSILLLLAGSLGASVLYDRSTRDASGRSPRDVEQILELTDSEARSGVEDRGIHIEKTGGILYVSVEPGTKNGTRLRFPRQGLEGGFVSRGDLYLIVKVKGD